MNAFIYGNFSNNLVSSMCIVLKKFLVELSVSTVLKYFPNLVTLGDIMSFELGEIYM